jgi:DNA polymerase-3 subunit beta
MKISIDKSVLVSALDTVSKAAPSGKTTMAILEGVLLEAQDKQLHFTRNNLEVAIKLTVDCEVLKPGAVVVNAKLFTDIIKRMPDAEIDISSNDTKMEIEAEQARMEIRVVPPDGFPAMPEVKPKDSFEIDQQILKEMVAGVAFAIAQDELHGATLTGICINAKGGILDVVGIDGYSMAWRKIAMDLGDLRILPKGVDLENICRLLDKGIVKVSAGESLVELVTENMRVTLRALNGDYLNYKAIIPSDSPITARIKTKEFQQTLERALLFRESAGEGKVHSAMVINVTTKGLKLTFASNNGSFDEDYSADVEGGDLKVGFDPLKMYNCLKHIEDKEVLMKFTNNIGPCTIVPVDGDSYAYMVLPVRV